MSERSHATELDFEGLAPIEIPVTLPGGDKYVLTQAKGIAASRYMNVRAKCATFVDGGLSRAEGIGNLPRLLVQLTLFRAKEDGSPDLSKQISQQAVDSLPYSVIKPIAAEALKISDIDDDADLASLKKQRKELDERIVKMEEDEDTVKNLSSDTETGLNSPQSEDTVDPLST